MPEWLNGAVSKTVIPRRGIEGSNPSLSAIAHRSFSAGEFFSLWASADAVRFLVRNP